MNKRVIWLMTLVLASVLADPTSKQKVSSDNNQPLSQSTSEEAKHDDKPLLNKTDSEQKNQITNTNVKTREDAANIEDSNVELIINVEETIDPVEEQFPQIQDVLNIDDGDFKILDREDFNRDEAMESNPDEIMQTAAGFVPVPIIRKFRQKQKARRRVATRRQFKRHPRPYTPWRYLYPYSYYSFYRPSSLRYFY
ncbi:uncharacterized protein LOC106132075 [Amyelois transitella]|uniref:uncharacterized protein LOC106132075 n=1 Tax=Amyelois transitella TaxID=680683 RepID=UPI00067D6171|nr:uncharacterized protein LOC106132075 [Amyelois transitella]